MKAKNYVKLSSRFVWLAKSTYLCHHRLRRFKLSRRTAVYVSYFPLNTPKFPHAAKNPGKSLCRQKHRATATKRAQPTACTVGFPSRGKYFPFRRNSEFIQEARGKAAPCKYVCTVSSPRFKWQIVGFLQFKRVFCKHWKTSQNLKLMGIFSDSSWRVQFLKKLQLKS